MIGLVGRESYYFDEGKKASFSKLFLKIQT